MGAPTDSLEEGVDHDDTIDNEEDVIAQWEQVDSHMQRVKAADALQCSLQHLLLSAEMVAAGILEDEQIVRISYHSRLRSPRNHLEDAHGVISKICRQAMQKNPLLQIGGMLCFEERSGAIVQEIEGPESAVHWLYGRIACDPRHDSLLLIHKEVIPTNKRKHTSFGMRFGTLDEGALSSDMGGHTCVRLVYTSLLCANGTVTSALASTIVRTSAKRNPQLGIGGELFLHSQTGQVVQVLEGPADVVRALYRTIERDLRHTRCTLLRDEDVPAAERCYGQWGMEQSDFGNLTARIGPELHATVRALWQQWACEGLAPERFRRMRPSVDFASDARRPRRTRAVSEAGQNCQAISQALVSCVAAVLPHR